MSIEVDAPESLDEIKLRQYMEYLSTEGLEELTKEQHDNLVVRIFLNLPKEIVGKIPFVEVTRVATMILTMFDEQKNLHGIFKLNGKEYGFIPQIDKISFNEHSDLGKYISDWSQMHKAMAVMYRPTTLNRKGKYLIEDYEGSAKYADEMLDAPLAVVFGALVFFYNLANDLLNYIPNYLQEEMKTQNLSLSSGDDITNLLLSLSLLVNQLKQLASVPFTNVTID